MKIRAIPKEMLEKNPSEKFALSRNDFTNFHSFEEAYGNNEEIINPFSEYLPEDLSLLQNSKNSYTLRMIWILISEFHEDFERLLVNQEETDEIMNEIDQQISN